jgi:hypothetical protein
VNAPDFRAILTQPAADTIAQFEATFGDALTEIAISLQKSFAELTDFDELLPDSPRASYVEHYLVYALDCVVVSTRLLNQGLLPPSGHMMRQYGEATATALLLSHPQLPDFDQYMRDRDRYPFHKALELVNKRETRKLLGISEEGWRGMMNICDSYDDLSHPSPLATFQVILLERKGLATLGGDYDSGKHDLYVREFHRRTSAASLLGTTVRACARYLGVAP